jgi:hypothetical protein
VTRSRPIHGPALPIAIHFNLLIAIHFNLLVGVQTSELISRSVTERMPSLHPGQSGSVQVNQYNQQIATRRADTSSYCSAKAFLESV